MIGSTERVPLLLGTKELVHYSAMDDAEIQPEKKHVVIICSENDFDIDGGTSAVDLASFQEFSYYKHLADIASMSFPIIASEIFQNVLPIVSIYFVGNLGSDELAACALASTWFNIWNAMMQGLMTATDTFLAQAYGSKNYHAFGVWAGNSVIVVVIAAIPACCLVALCGPAMNLIGREPELVDAAGAFAIQLVPGLLPYFIFKVLTKYLQAQNILAPSVWIGIIANIFNAFFNWFLIYKAGWGIDGSPWATNFTRVLQLILLSGYLLIKKRNEPTWLHFSGQNLTLDVMEPFWEIALPGSIATSAQMWMGEALTILASDLGTISLGAHTIVGNLCTFLFLSFPMAIGMAASIRVGQLTGASKPTDAKKCFHASLFISITTQAVLVLCLYSCKTWLSEVFTIDRRVSSITLSLLSIMFVVMMGDTINVTVGGVMRGLGRQNWYLMINLLPSWCVGVPMSIVLAFKMGYGICGLWWGMMLGTYSSSLVGLAAMYVFVDWENEAHKALTRLSSLGQFSSNSKMTSSLTSASSTFRDMESLEEENTAPAVEE